MPIGHASGKILKTEFQIHKFPGSWLKLRAWKGGGVWYGLKMSSKMTSSRFSTSLFSQHQKSPKVNKPVLAFYLHLD